MIYKALVRDRMNEIVIITSEYPTKNDFIKDLRSNGYKVNVYKVKTEEEFNHIMDHTNCEETDWNPNKYKKYLI